MSATTMHLTPRVPKVRTATRAAATRSEVRDPLRLTRRGRLMVLVIVVVALACALLTVAGGPADSSSSPHHAPARTVVVEPGQTLWDIAQHAAPEVDTRTVVADIVELNSLSDGGSVRAGQPLDVPGY